MKTFTLSKKILSLCLLFISITVSPDVFSQTGSELVFKNSYLLSGTAGQDGAKYVFPSVKTGIDAVLTIQSRSNSKVILDQIDEIGTGFNNAFQPRIGYNGTVPPNSNWWMQFDITFYVAGNYTPPYKVQINNFKATGLDIDGDNSGLREYSQMNEITSFATSSPTLLQPTLIASLPVNPYSNLPEYTYKFLGPITVFPGIDTTAVSVMVTSQYMYKKSITFRIGGQTGSDYEASSPSRQNSIWFKEFSLSTLPVKLTSFTATLNNNNKVDLKWITASEINTSHFVVERSFDGIHFSVAGLVFAYGNAYDNTNYSFADNPGNSSATVIYYRLRSVDMDSKIEYSETRMVRIGKAKENTISIFAFPNPVVSGLHITIPASWQNKAVTYQVYCINGQVVNRKQTSSSSQTETINISTLAPGIYIIKASCGTEAAQQKFVKQ